MTWLNQKFDKREADSIQCGLQKTIFSYEKDRSSGKPIVTVVNHPRKKTQEELWKEMLGEENLELKLIEYSG